MANNFPRQVTDLSERLLRQDDFIKWAGYELAQSAPARDEQFCKMAHHFNRAHDWTTSESTVFLVAEIAVILWLMFWGLR